MGMKVLKVEVYGVSGGRSQQGAQAGDLKRKLPGRE
jgi:hypothetical protein